MRNALENSIGKTLFLELPARPVDPGYKLVGIVKVGNLHGSTIPQQFLSAIELGCLVAICSRDLFAQHVTPDGQVTHENGFSERSGVVE